MSNIYRGMEFELPYPDNWTYTEEKQEDWVDSVTLESPGAAFLCIQRQSVGAKADEVLQVACDAMKEEYDELEQEDLVFDVGDDESFGCDLSFYYLDLLVSCRLLAFTVGEFTYLIQLQGEDREFQRLRPLLKGMLGKAFQSLDPEFAMEELPE